MKRASQLILAVFLFAATANAVETPISTTSPAPTSKSVGSAGVVPLGDGFLTYWREGSICYSSELRGARLDRNGRLLDDRSFIIAPSKAIVSIIGGAGDADGAYIAWSANETTGTVAHLTRVNADGTVTSFSDAVPITHPLTMRKSGNNILFLGSDALHDAPLVMTLVDRAGAVIRSNVSVIDPADKILSDSREADLVAVGDQFLLAWISADGRVRVSRIPPADVAAGTVSAAPYVSQPGGTAHFIKLASNGVNTMAFWREFNVNELRGRPLSPSGAPINSAPITVRSIDPGSITSVVATTSGYQVSIRETKSSGAVYYDQFSLLQIGFDGSVQSTSSTTSSKPMVLAANGDQAIAAWNQLRFDIANSTGGLEEIAAPIAAGGLGAEVIVSRDDPVQHVRKILPFGGGFAALWTEGSPNDRVVVGRINAFGKPIDGAGLHLSNSEFDQSGSAVATDGRHLFVVWTEGSRNAEKRNLYGAVVSANGELTANTKLLANDASSDSDLGVVWTGNSYTIAYRRTTATGTNYAGDFAAFRIDDAGNVVDPAPVEIMAAEWGSKNPRLSWSGSEYLMVWQRFYDPFFYIATPPPCWVPPALPAELFAQRLDAALTPVGAPLDIARTTNLDDYLLDVQNSDVSYSGSLWLVSWYDQRFSGANYARVSSNGVRLDPLDGKSVMWALGGGPFLSPSNGGWTMAVPQGNGILALVNVGPEGLRAAPATTTLSRMNTFEAFALTPFPIVAYKRVSSSAAYIDTLPLHSRAVRH
jgi:hypothetical protein